VLVLLMLQENLGFLCQVVWQELVELAAVLVPSAWSELHHRSHSLAV